jgi:hypothetical protein
MDQCHHANKFPCIETHGADSESYNQFDLEKRMLNLIK